MNPEEIELSDELDDGLKRLAPADGWRKSETLPTLRAVARDLKAHGLDDETVIVSIRAVFERAVQEVTR